jgi:diamine N-acetyltransferase
VTGDEKKITLKQIRAKTLVPIINLDVHPDQGNLVAPNAWSIAQAHYSKNAWYRAIYAGDEPVGFVMVYIDKVKPEYFLWRLMVDKTQQGKGYGYKAMQIVIDFVRTLPKAKELSTSYVPADGDPSPFYRKLGFEETEEMIEGEKVMRLVL